MTARGRARQRELTKVMGMGKRRQEQQRRTIERTNSKQRALGKAMEKNSPDRPKRFEQGLKGFALQRRKKGRREMERHSRRRHWRRRWRQQKMEQW